MYAVKRRRHEDGGKRQEYINGVESNDRYRNSRVSDTSKFISQEGTETDKDLKIRRCVARIIVKYHALHHFTLCHKERNVVVVSRLLLPRKTAM